jgi:uncharacterized membrane protein
LLSYSNKDKGAHKIKWNYVLLDFNGLWFSMKKFLFKLMRERTEEKRMSLESSKTLGGVGAILLLVGTLPVIGTYTFGIIGLVGLILVLIALYRLANFYNEKGIFNNAIYGVLAAVVGAVVTAIVAIIAVLASLSSLEAFIGELYPGWTPGDWAALSGMTPTVPSNIDFSPLASFLAAILAIFAVIIIFAIVATYFVRRSLKQLSEKTKVGLFSTAGLILFIGAFMLILLIIPGLIVMWIAVLILAIAFFQIKPEQTPMTTAPSSPTPTTS